MFTGPFRALAELILEHRMDVCDVPLARITERFLARARDAETWSLEEATWFLAVCSAFLELKVGRLMPRHTEPLEEDLLGGPSPDLAFARSLELAAFRRVAVDLVRTMEEAAAYLTRAAGPPPELAHLYPDPMEKVTPDLLASTAGSLLRPPPPVDMSHVQPIRVTMAQALREVTDRLGGGGAVRFRDLVADCEERIHVVVRFLALLELYRDGKVELSQARTFGEIEITWQEEAR
ncbi:MAG: segregation/condensation protein A [Actinobacteria bacterium]|nr:segregation/condensation protein A [Actinomycetota bacterium]